MPFASPLWRNKVRGGIFNPASIQSAVLQQLLFWKQAVNGSIIPDESTNKGDARPVQLGRCYHFDGTDDWVVVPNNPQIALTDNFSVTIRAKNDVANLAGIQSLFGKFQSNPGNLRSWALAFDATERLYLIVSSNGTAIGQYTSTAAIDVGNTHTYGATFEGGTIKLFVDGAEVAGSVTSGTIPSTIFSGTAPLTFGVVNPAAPVVLWDGQQFDARIYNSVLTEAEMLAVHNNDEVQYAPVAWYKMDEQEGTTAYDSSGFGNHGTITNATLGTFHDTQDIISFQNKFGFSQYMNFDGTNDAVVLPTTLRSDLDGKSKVGFKAKIFLPAYPTSVTRAIISVPIGGSTSGFRLGVDVAGNLSVNGDITVFTGDINIDSGSLQVSGQTVVSIQQSAIPNSAYTTVTSASGTVVNIPQINAALTEIEDTLNLILNALRNHGLIDM